MGLELERSHGWASWEGPCMLPAVGGASALCGLDLGGGRPVPVAAASPAVGKTE